MHRALRIGLLSCVVTALLALSACGVSGAGSAAQSTPSTTVIMSPAPSATASSTSAAATGAVAITVDQQHYGTKDTIVVHVTNGLSNNIYAGNHQTDCTIVTLEMNSGGAWQPTGACRTEIATIFLPVRAGTTATFDLTPSSGGQLKSSAWAAGTYHVALRYTLSNPESGSAPPSSFETAYSVTFGIG